MTQAWDAAGFGPGDARIEPYTNTRKSIETIARMARDDRHDPDIRGWASDQLKAAGYDGRNRTATIVQTAQVILDAVRANTVYVPDPAGSEWIQKAHVTLCLRNKCIRGVDCDDAVVALATLLLSIGVGPYIVKQEFGYGQQEHVLVGLVDERGGKWYADPANTMRAVYQGSRAVNEYWVDPLEQVGDTGRSSPDFVTLGAAPKNSGTLVVMRPPQLNAQLSPGVGASAFGLVSMADIDQLDEQVQAGVQALQAAAQACGTLSQSDQDALNGFAAAWATLHQQWQTVRTTLNTATTTSTIGMLLLPIALPAQIATSLAGAIALQLTTFANDMRGYLVRVGDWQARLKQVCPNYAPPPGAPTPVPAPDQKTPVQEVAETVTSAAKAVGTVLLIGGLVYGGYWGLTLLRSLPKPVR